MYSFDYIVYAEELSGGAHDVPSGIYLSFDPMWDWYYVKIDHKKADYREALWFVQRANDYSLLTAFKNSHIEYKIKKLRSLDIVGLGEDVERQAEIICNDEKGIIGVVNTEEKSSKYEPFLTRPAPAVREVMTLEEEARFSRDLEDYKNTGNVELLSKYESLWDYRQATGWDKVLKEQEQELTKAIKKAVDKKFYLHSSALSGLVVLSLVVSALGYTLAGVGLFALVILYVILASKIVTKSAD